MAADFWRLALRQMQVRASGLEERVKEMIDVGHDYFIPIACLISVLFSARYIASSLVMKPASQICRMESSINCIPCFLPV